MKIKSLPIIIILILFSICCFAGEEVRINFIDVGDGDAILVQAGNNNALIDAGNLLSGHKVLDILKTNNISRLNYLIITHPHPDHIGAAFFIVPEFQINEIFDNGQILDENDDVQRWYKRLVRSRENYRALKAGDSLKMDGIVLQVLWPDAPTNSSFNANSLVIMLRYKVFKCLLSADLNNIGEKKLLQQGLDLKSDILKVGHHGYFDATSKEFLQAVSPQIAIISVDANNIRGAPSESTLNLLKEEGVKIYRTDKNGTVGISVDKDGNFTIKTIR